MGRVVKRHVLQGSALKKDRSAKQKQVYRLASAKLVARRGLLAEEGRAAPAAAGVRHALATLLRAPAAR